MCDLMVSSSPIAMRWLENSKVEFSWRQHCSVNWVCVYFQCSWMPICIVDTCVYLMYILYNIYIRIWIYWGPFSSVVKPLVSQGVLVTIGRIFTNCTACHLSCRASKGGLTIEAQTIAIIILILPITVECRDKHVVWPMIKKGKQINKQTYIHTNKPTNIQTNKQEVNTFTKVQPRSLRKSTKIANLWKCGPIQFKLNHKETHVTNTKLAILIFVTPCCNWTALALTATKHPSCSPSTRNQCRKFHLQNHENTMIHCEKYTRFNKQRMHLRPVPYQNRKLISFNPIPQILLLAKR